MRLHQMAASRSPRQYPTNRRTMMQGSVRRVLGTSGRVAIALLALGGVRGVAEASGGVTAKPSHCRKDCKQDIKNCLALVPKNKDCTGTKAEKKACRKMNAAQRKTCRSFVKLCKQQNPSMSGTCLPSSTTTSTVTTATSTTMATSTTTTTLPFGQTTTTTTTLPVQTTTTTTTTIRTATSTTMPTTSPCGAFVTAWGSPTFEPPGVAVDGSGSVFVSDG